MPETLGTPGAPSLSGRDSADPKKKMISLDEWATLSRSTSWLWKVGLGFVTGTLWGSGAL